MTMLGFLTLPSFVLGLVFGWLAVVNNGNLTPALPATGIQLWELVILLTSYGGLQALIAAACFAYDELPRQQVWTAILGNSDCLLFFLLCH
jgi:hypothetical protein